MSKIPKGAVFLLSALLILIPPQASMLHPQAPIMLYHHIDRSYGRWHVLPVHLEQQLMYLSSNGYKTVSMAAYLDAIESGKTLPEKSIVLTFDDGYEDSYLNAFPLLKRYSMTGTFFIITQRVGLPGYLTWAQIAEMQRAGMEIGAHTLHHPFLTHLPAWRAFIEIFGSRVDLWLHLGTFTNVLAYPYNDHNAEVVKLARLAGFRGALTVSPHKGDVNSDPFEIPRVTITSGEQMRTFALVLRRGG